MAGIGGSSVRDPDLEIKWGGGGHPDLQIKGGSLQKNNFFSACQASVWSKNKGGLDPLILGDPGAVSGVDYMFVVKVCCKIETSPWALTLTEPVPEAFELPASDWPEKFFLANQRREAAG